MHTDSSEGEPKDELMEKADGLVVGLARVLREASSLLQRTLRRRKIRDGCH